MINQLVDHFAFCGYVCPWFEIECYASCVIYVVVGGLKYCVWHLY